MILMLSVLVGFLNGALVTWLKIDSFIATMGVGTLLYGISNWYSNGEQIVGMSLSDSFTNMTGIFHGLPLPALYVGCRSPSSFGSSWSGCRSAGTSMSSAPMSGRPS